MMIDQISNPEVGVHPRKVRKYSLQNQNVKVNP
jgi:hypothetical protein